MVHIIQLHQHIVCQVDPIHLNIQSGFVGVPGLDHPGGDIGVPCAADLERRHHPIRPRREQDILIAKMPAIKSEQQHLQFFMVTFRIIHNSEAPTTSLAYKNFE